VLLWNLALICKVQFDRDRPITKLTFKPYVLSFSFLVAQLIETWILVYENEKGERMPAPDKKHDVMIFSFELQRKWTQTLFSIKFLLYYGFVLMQSFEIELLCLFVLF